MMHATCKQPGTMRQLSHEGACCALIFALLCSISGSPSAARADSKQQMQSLDEQVQEIKSDVLGIAAELSSLEEKLLYALPVQHTSRRVRFPCRG
jgi:hypothetical protein